MSDRQRNRFQGLKYLIQKTLEKCSKFASPTRIQNPRQRIDAVKNNYSDNAEVFPPEISI